MTESQEEYADRLREELKHAPPSWFEPIKGYKSRATKDGRAGLVSQARVEAELAAARAMSHGEFFDLTPLKKRTDAQRAESMASRIWKAVQDGEPLMVERVLREIHGEKWKAGDPITYEEVRAWAVEQLKQAAISLKQKEHR